MRERGQKVQISSSKKNKSWGHNLEYGDIQLTQWAYLEFAKRGDLQGSHHEKKIVTMMDVT